MTYNPTEYLPLAKSIARRFAADWPGIDADDLYGELSLKIVENQRYLSKADNANAATAALLRKKAAEYCATERNRALFGTSHYLYGAEEVAALVDVFYLPRDAWGEAAPIEVMGGREKARDGQDTVTGLVDVSAGMERLSEAQRGTIREVWEHGQAEAARRAGQTASTFSRAYWRAIGALTVAMNTNRVRRTDDHDGPGSRTAMSNESARALTTR
ncbi:hypothetical protein [Streptomyces smyrnaeus]|uniref:hypothetical protein n=1 Tax=Streptomyces smyrnaeus TaxID=1387713 RepID=UPI0036A300BE